MWVRKTAISALLAAAFATPALADNEQINLFAVSCVDGNTCQTTHGSGGLALESYAYSSASGFSGGIVNAHAGFSPNPDTLSGTFINRANADLTYTFQVTGTAGVSVPVHVHGYASLTPITASTFHGGQLTLKPDGTASDTSGFSIQSAVSIDISGIGSTDAYGHVYTSGAHVDAGNNSDNLDLKDKSVLIDKTIYFQTNSDISVEIFAGAALKYNFDGGTSSIFGGVSASADPTFTIDDPAYSAFKIVGVPNDPMPPIGAVPEPANWAMLVAGIGMVGGAMRRRRVDVRFA